MSHRAFFVFAASILTLSACDRPPPQPAAPSVAAVQVAAPPPPSVPLVAKVHKSVMICRNSQTGSPAACGTPNAVMVGIKTE